MITETNKKNSHANVDILNLFMYVFAKPSYNSLSLLFYEKRDKSKTD